jgi:hypothetical protein
MIGITFEPKRSVIVLGAIVICLILANITGMISYYGFGHSRIGLFDLDREPSIPTVYQSATLLLCAGLLAVIAAARKRQAERDYLHWAGLSVIFLFLSIDEAAGIHERLIVPLRTALHTSGALFYAWVIPYGVFAAALLLVYLRFLFSLPRKTRRLMILAGAVYVTGALGFELIDGYWLGRTGQPDLIYAILTTFEETLEMAGTLVLIYSLMSFAASELRGVFLHIGSLTPTSAEKAA